MMAMLLLDPNSLIFSAFFVVFCSVGLSEATKNKLFAFFFCDSKQCYQTNRIKIPKKKKKQNK